MLKVNGHNFEFIKFQDLSEDLKIKVLYWRNDKEIRKWMYNTNLIDLKQHLNFLNSLNSSKDKIYFLVKRGGIPIGVFSLIDIKAKNAEWGYYMAPEFQQKNLGVEFYYAILKFCFDQLKFKNIYGYALVSNRAANSLNSLFGFSSKTLKKEDDKESYKLRTLNKEIWYNEIVNNSKIVKLLELTK